MFAPNNNISFNNGLCNLSPSFTPCSQNRRKSKLFNTCSL